MASHEEIRELMKAWVDVPTLTAEQKAMVQSLYEVSQKDDMMEFIVFKDLMCNQFEHDMRHAIIKAKAEGLGVKVH